MRRRGAAAALLLLGALALQACVARLPGCGAEAAMDALSSLRCGAARGDKQAQLELGILYEEGRGVERSPRKAARLYQAAGSASGGTVYVYSPPVGGEKSGRVIPINAGPRQAGLAEAQYRLALLHLDGSAGERNPGRARKLLERASRAGHKAATALLLRLRPSGPANP